jgi:hypothetical protein
MNWMGSISRRAGEFERLQSSFGTGTGERTLRSKTLLIVHPNPTAPSVSTAPAPLRRFGAQVAASGKSVRLSPESKALGQSLGVNPGSMNTLFDLPQMPVLSFRTSKLLP